MAQIQSKLAIFAMEKYDGYVLVDEDQNSLPAKRLNEKEILTTLQLAKQLFSNLTNISPTWPTLIFSLGLTQETPTASCHEVNLVYSVYLERLVSVKDQKCKWVKISELTKDFLDYNVILELGKKRYV